MRNGRLTAFGVMVAVSGLLACGGDAADDRTGGTTSTPAGTATGTTASGPDLASVELPEGMTMEMVEAGRVAFQTTICYTCHGMDGTGTPLAPDMTDGEWLNTDGSPEGIEQIIRNGVPNPIEAPAPMPPMGGAQLSEEQIQNLVAYVYALSHAN